jgi:hydroxymethylpyrimidine pyrophosphatase-like HAD family hydrolase
MRACVGQDTRYARAFGSVRGILQENGVDGCACPRKRGAMKYRALATDYDGTIAHDGRVDAATVDALRRVRAAGHRLIMVTGRELTDLFNTFEYIEAFDRVVAENGAVLYDPASQSVEVLAPAPPSPLLQALTQKNVPFSVGHCVVATVEPHEHAVLAAIHELGLEWHVIFNKGAVMALPAEVTKATGLAPALDALGVSRQETIAVGDAENDQVFLRVCGLAVAVDNALTVVKDMADLVTAGARGAGVTELIDRWLSGGLDAVAANPEKHRA